MVCVLLSFLPVGYISFFLFFSLLLISHWGMAIIPLFIISFITLVVGTSFIPLGQLLFRLLIALGELLDCSSEGLHLSFKGVGWVPGLLVDGSH